MTELSPEEWGNRYRNIRGTCEALTGTEAWHSRKQRRRRA
jgi:hypothetical protein